MAESRLLVVAADPGLPGALSKYPESEGLGGTAPAELSTSFLNDVTMMAKALPPKSGIHVELAPPVPEVQDPGERLARIFRDGFASGAASICVIGTSAPHLPGSYLLEAFGRLTRHPASIVVGPTMSGTYYLIGASGADPCPLLKDIPWGTANVLRETLRRANISELSTSLLPSIMVVETSDHLRQLSRDLRRGVAVAPHTHSILRNLELA